MQVTFALSPAGRAFRRHPPTIPLVVIGALKAGGSGKTSVTLALAQTFSERGLKVAILAYRIGQRGPDRSRTNHSQLSNPDPVLSEVKSDEDWRRSSDEAVLLRQQSGCRVFVTRNRALAWMRLHAPEVYGSRPFDLILSDDGFQDPRLKGAMRIVLMAPGERPGVFDLLPGGAYRQTWSEGRNADLILEGPCGTGNTPIMGTREEGGKSVHRFYRELCLPKGFEPKLPWIAYCGLGDNQSFLDALDTVGCRPVQVVQGRNHATPNLKKLQFAIALNPKARILCTRKDGIKLEPIQTGSLPISVVDQRIFLDPSTVALVEAFRLGFGSGNLVHYDK